MACIRCRRLPYPAVSGNQDFSAIARYKSVCAEMSNTSIITIVNMAQIRRKPGAENSDHSGTIFSPYGRVPPDTTVRTRFAASSILFYSHVPPCRG